MNKLTNSVEVHSVAGWIMKDSGVVPQNYEKKFHFVHAGTEEEFIGPQAELMRKTGLSNGLISMMLHKNIEHAKGWFYIKTVKVLSNFKRLKRISGIIQRLDGITQERPKNHKPYGPWRLK